MSSRTASRKISFTLMLGILVVFSALVLQSPLVWTNVHNDLIDTTIVGDDTMNTNPDLDESSEITNHSEVSPPTTTPQQSGDASTWWNEIFEFRRKITITEPNVQSRDLWPVELTMTFLNNTAYKNSIRIIYFDGSSQTEVPSQTYNAIYWQNGTSPITYSDFLQSVNIIFSVTITQNTQKTYYVYYSASVMTNNYATYYSQTGMSTSFANGRVAVNTNVLKVEFAEGTAYDRLEYSSGDGAGLNFHTDTSMSPSAHIITAGSSQTYLPDAQGYIRDWLLVGAFETGTWANSRTLYGDFVDPDLYYVEGDPATPTDPALPGSDPSKTWFIHHSSAYRLNLDTIFGSQTTSAIYGMVYVYFPNDIPALYIRPGSDDGIRVFMDTNEVWDNHVLRAWAEDTNINVGFVAAGWHAFLLMCEENTGEYYMSLRFSSTSGTYTGIPGLVIAHIPKTNIQTITLLESGPVFSKFNIEWEQSGDMLTFENVTFYHGISMYRSTRVFWWADWHNSTAGNSWTVANTNYPTISTTKMDVFVKDGTVRSLSLDQFNAEEYVVVYDNSGDNYYSVQGLFITDYFNNSVPMILTSLNTTAYYNNYRPFIIPGYQTDMDNRGTHPNYDGSESYSVTVELWEFTKKYVSSANPSQVGTVLNGVYSALTTPLQADVSAVEPLFFNIKFTLYDADYSLAPNVEITLYNTTTNWGGIILPAIGTQTTNLIGSTTFYNLKGMNLTYVITYQAYSRPAVELKRDNITLDTSQELSIYNLNLTTLLITLTDINDPLVLIYGANVSLYWNNTGGPDGTYIGYEISDTAGQVWFYYLNSSEIQGNYTIKVQTYGEFRRINSTYENPAFADYNINFTLSNYTSVSISVQINDYTTKLIQTPSLGLFTPYWGDNFNVNYSYLYGPSGSETLPILFAQITYNIRDYSTGLVVKSGIFTANGTTGSYNLTFVTSDLGFSLSTSDLYSFEIDAFKAGFLPQTKSFTLSIQNISTTLSVDALDDEITVIWGEVISITANFSDVSNPLLPIAISDGQITYNVTGVPTITGYLGSIGLGQYHVELNSIAFGSSGTYTILLEANKDKYETKQLEVTLYILVVPTIFELNVENIESIWKENFTISVSYFDYINDSIEDGSVTFSVGQVIGLNGSLNHQADGVYVAELNTTQFPGVGSYTMELFARKSQYTSKTLLLYITINRIETSINNSIFLTIEKAINVSTSTVFYVNYLDDLNIGVSNAYIAYYEWQTTTGTIQSGREDLQDLENGLYLLDFNTESRSVGIYLLVIHIGQANYVERAGSITLQIKERPIQVVLSSNLAQNKIERPEGSQIPLEFSLIDPVTSLPLTGATVYMEYRGNSYNFVEITPGTYRYTIDTSTGEYKALAQAKIDVAQVYISKTNYTISSFSLTISVTPPEFRIGNLGIPKIFVYIGGSVALVALIAVGSWQYIVYAKIPLIVKKIERIKKIIGRNKVAPDQRVSPTINEEIVALFAADWKLLDLDLQSILGGNKASIEGMDSKAPSDQPQGGI